MNLILSCRCRSDSMMPLMPSPGIPKIVSTPHARSPSTRMSAAVVAMAVNHSIAADDRQDFAGDAAGAARRGEEDGSDFLRLRGTLHRGLRAKCLDLFGG